MKDNILLTKYAVQLLLLIVSLTFFPLTQAKIIMVFGDSLSAGYGLDINEGWVTLLENRLRDKSKDYRIVNSSISGNTSGNGLARIKQDLQLHSPDILVLELGGNDGLRGHSPKMFKSNMAQIIKISQAKDVEVMLLGIKLPPSYGRRYGAAFEAVYSELAIEYQLPLVPFFMDKVAINKALMQRDGIHPNVKGQPQLLENVWPVLNTLLSD